MHSVVGCFVFAFSLRLGNQFYAKPNRPNVYVQKTINLISQSAGYHYNFSFDTRRTNKCNQRKEQEKSTTNKQQTLKAIRIRCSSWFCFDFSSSYLCRLGFFSFFAVRFKTIDSNRYHYSIVLIWCFWRKKVYGYGTCLCM